MIKVLTQQNQVQINVYQGNHGILINTCLSINTN